MEDEDLHSATIQNKSSTLEESLISTEQQRRESSTSSHTVVEVAMTAAQTKEEVMVDYGRDLSGLFVGNGKSSLLSA